MTERRLAKLSPGQLTSNRLVNESMLSRITCRTADECWPWSGWLQLGYGVMDTTLFGDGRRYRLRAHQWSYEYFVGPIPDGLVLDHLCAQKRCCNPRHLEPVTDAENILRGTSPSAKNARKTHCDTGHPLSGDNLYVDPEGKRRCRACWRIRAQRYRARIAEREEREAA